jgi:DNA-binding GntR family transcriptional regulator
MGAQTKKNIGDADLASLSALGRRKSLGQHVFENLKHAILRGDIPPGNRLVENRLAETMGISRTPVREAMHKLEREGIIQKLPNSGFTVTGLTREDIEETFGIRSVLESYAARLAAVNHEDGELAPLGEKIEEYQMCLDQGRLEDLPEINTQFHDILYDLSRSPKLIKMVNDLRDQIYRFRKIILKAETRARASNDDHRRMLRAMQNRDADRVERLVKEHILRGKRMVLRELKNKSGAF